MKRAFVIFQWVVFVAMIGVFVWGVVRRPPPPDYDPTHWRNWEGFSVISYSGVPRESYDRYINKEGLADHLAALKAAGFHTIKPEDAAAFLEGRAPLPDRALLILFEGGRKDSFIAATPLLRKFGFVATYGVPTGLTEKWGSFYVRKADIAKLSGEANWSFASMGHHAIGTIPVDAAGMQQGFLTHRMWLKDRVETDAEARSRITNDYAEAAALIKRESGKPPAVFIAPYQVGGPWSVVEDAVMRANNIGIDAETRIAFMRNEGSFNGPGTNPHNLTRLNAGGNLGGDELVKKLRAAMPRAAGVEGIKAANQEWFTIGPARADDGKVAASVRGRAWLQGSSGWADLEVNTKLKRMSTNVLSAIYVRYTGPGSYLRVAIGSDVIRVQERLEKTMQTLAQFAVTNSARLEHDVRIRVKGNRAWITVDGELIGGGPAPLTFATARGAVGLTSDNGTSTLTDFSARPIASVYAFASSIRDAPPGADENIVAMLPTWFIAGERARISESLRREALVAGARGIETIPVVEAATNVSGAAAEAYARQIFSVLDGSPATKTLIHAVALHGVNLTMAAALEQREIQVFFILSPLDAVLLARTNPEAFFRRSVILDCGRTDAELHAAVRQIQRVCSTERLIACGAIALPVGVGVAAKIEKPTEARP